MHHYKKLEIWKRSMDFALKVYECTKLFPDSEKFGLVSQLRRSSVSVPSNIAEGAGRNSVKEFQHFLSIALGSVFEVETQLLLSERLNFIEELISKTLLEELESISKMIFSLRKSLID